MKDQIEKVKMFVTEHKKTIAIVAGLIVAGTVAYMAIKRAKQSKRR